MARHLTAARMANLIHHAVNQAVTTDLRQNYHWSQDTPQRLASLTAAMLAAVDDTNNDAHAFYAAVRHDITNLFDAVLQDSELTRETAPALFRLADALWENSHITDDLLGVLDLFSPEVATAA